MKAMVHTLVLAAALVVMGAWPALAKTPDLTGKYEVERTLYTVRVDILQKGDRIGLVAYIHTVVGSDYTYHFFGSITGDKVEAKHSQGHVFKGTIDSKGDLKGVVHTRWGKDYDIEAGPNNRVSAWSDGKKRPPATLTDH